MISFFNRAFRAEVAIETLRIWRLLVEQNRRQQPEAQYEISVAEEAAHLALRGPRAIRRQVRKQAIKSVSHMTVYSYNLYEDGDYVGKGNILAHSALDAALKVSGCALIELGFGDDLRVRITDGAVDHEPTDFYKYQFSN